MMLLNTVLDLGGAMLRVSTPLFFAALGGLFCERSGVTNIALEGKMLLGAFTAAAIATAMHSENTPAMLQDLVLAHPGIVPWFALAAATIVGLIFGAFYGLFAIYWRSNQIVAATALNMLAMGLTPFLCKVFFDSTSSTPSLSLDDRFVFLPMILALASLLFAFIWFRYLKAGLWMSLAGEHPEALETAGISVLKMRWTGVLLAGMFASWGGATLSICLSSGYSRNMTAGRGFVALAALILGKWSPFGTIFACLMLGLADAFQMRLQGVVLWGTEPVPVQFIQILPYVVTIIVLAGFVGRSRAPAALGIPQQLR